MRRLSLGVLLVALSTLVLELMLTRAFDVTLTPNLSYFVVSLAVFSFGLAGIYATVRPVPLERDIQGRLAGCCIAIAVAVLLLQPIINALPLDYQRIVKHPITTILAFGALYGALLVPFFLAGYVLIAVFSKYAAMIQRLYFWDLSGAALGTLLVLPLIIRLGPGGLIVCAASLMLLAAALFSRSTRLSASCAVAALALAAVPIIRGQSYIDFRYHIDKRGILTAVAEGRDELVRWDPISKIDIIDQSFDPREAPPGRRGGDRKAIQYDGGNQTSYFYRFDGDLKALRQRIERDPTHIDESFWQIGVLASHHLKRDSGQQVLVIGSAGGQETKAALMYGATYVDTVELVPTVVELATGRYSSYIGDVFHHPAVHAHAEEGRSFLRRTPRTYDIIQIYSNHTSSSIAQGSGAMAPVYLQTEEAYEEYFSHLSANGVLHINHYAYPRMITTAALAWRRMGRADFMRHVAVYFSPSQLTLPTVLIKMSPWTPGELADVSAFLAPPSLASEERQVLVESPLPNGPHFLSAQFFSGSFPADLARSIPIDFTPRTDDNPYFGQLRKQLGFLEPDPKHFVDPGSAYTVNIALVRGIPMDEVHLYVTALASLLFAVLFVLVPLKFSAVGREQRGAALPLLAYFSCLGAGFIIIELVLIQKFMHLIGSPLYTYSTVLCTLLLAAGLGSVGSERLRMASSSRWIVPFAAIVALGVALILIYPQLARLALGLSLSARILVSSLLIFPLGFFLGMPFPLGILAIADRPRGAIAWAWGMNGLFTVIGGLASVLLGLVAGFNNAILIALLLYAVALVAYRSLRPATQPATAHAAPAPARVAPNVPLPPPRPITPSQPS